MKRFIIYSILLAFALIYSKAQSPFTELTGTGLPALNHSSAAWGDYNNDGYKDLLICGSNGTTRYTKLFKNNGNNTFTEQTSISIPAVSDGSCEWGDYNGDGYLDILISGLGTSGSITKVFKNNGNNSFTETASLQGLNGSSVSWGDYDNDGDLDILISGKTDANAVTTKVYRNDGNNTFNEVTSISVSAQYQGTSAWVDYNRDGLLDIYIYGRPNTTADYLINKLFKHNADGTFTQIDFADFPGATMGRAVWGDCDNDGDVDLVVSGGEGTFATILYQNDGNDAFTEMFVSASGGSITLGDFDIDGYMDVLISGSEDGSISKSAIFRNKKDNTFEEETPIALAGARNGCAAWCDINHDGKLDIFYTGQSGSLATSNTNKIYINNFSGTNNIPSAPANPNANVNANVVTLTWDKSPDNDETPQNGLSYNFYVGTTSKTGNIAPSMSDNLTGFRKINSMGNAFSNTTVALNNLPDGTYYWSVQAIDNSFQGGPFAQEGVFDVGLSSRLDQTISFGALPGKLLGDPDFAPSAGASSGLPVYFTSSDNIVASIISNKVHSVGAGTCNIIAHQDGNGTYKAAAPVSQPFTVTAGSSLLDQTITFDPIPQKTYGNADFNLNATASSGLPVSFSSSDTTIAKIINGKIHIVKAGGCIISAHQSGNGTYKAAPTVSQNLSVNGKPLYAVAYNQTRYCGWPNKPLRIGYIGFTNNENKSIIIEPSISTSALKNSPVGSYPIKLTDGYAPNYNITRVDGELKIVPPDPVNNSVSLCPGSYYILPRGDTVRLSGTYRDTLQTACGCNCDSIIVTKVTVITPLDTSESFVICPGDSIRSSIAHGKYYKIAGKFTEIYKSIHGCDSLVDTIKIIVLPLATVEAGQNKTICSNDTVTLVAKGIGKVYWKGYDTDSIKTAPPVTTVYTALAYNKCNSVKDEIKITVKPTPETPVIIGENKSLFTYASGDLQFQWYNKQDGIIYSAYDWLYKPKKSGEFYLLVTENGCLSDTSNIVQFTFVADPENPEDPLGLMNDQATVQLIVYPNPVKEYLKILTRHQKLIKVELFDILGKIVNTSTYSNQDAASIDMIKYKNGVYFVKITLDNVSLPVIKKIYKK